MNEQELKDRLDRIRQERLPLPGKGDTPGRHRRLMQIGREDLSLAKLAEAHWDAMAILAEAGRSPAPGAVYAVWAAEMPGEDLHLERTKTGYRVAGRKMFSSGIGLVDRALITVGLPEPRLIEVDMRSDPAAIVTDCSAWKTDAFQMTNTGSVTFHGLNAPEGAIVGEGGWYLQRPGFWHGACGPAACWAGGAAGLLDFAMESGRNDAHTLAHLAAIHANVWAMESYLETAGREIDEDPSHRPRAMLRALQLRHLVEQACTDTLRRFARAYGPYPLSQKDGTARRYHECDLYLRQSHAERDLEAIGRSLREEKADRCSMGLAQSR